MIHALEPAGDHGRAQIGQVGVRAYGIGGSVVCSVDVAGGAAPGDLEEHVRALSDLADPDLLAGRDIVRVRVGELKLDGRVDGTGSGDEARDVGIDNRTVVGPEDPGHVVAGGANLLLLEQPGEGAHQVAGLLRLEKQRFDVDQVLGRLQVVHRLGVHQEEPPLDVLGRRVPDRVGHLARDRDGQVGLGAFLQVGKVIVRGAGGDDSHSRPGALRPLQGQLIEAVVIDSLACGDQADGDSIG